MRLAGVSLTAAALALMAAEGPAAAHEGTTSPDLRGRVTSVASGDFVMQKYDGTTETVETTAGMTYSEPGSPTTRGGVLHGENVAVTPDPSASSPTARVWSCSQKRSAAASPTSRARPSRCRTSVGPAPCGSRPIPNRTRRARPRPASVTGSEWLRPVCPSRHPHPPPRRPPRGHSLAGLRSVRLRRRPLAYPAPPSGLTRPPAGHPPATAPRLGPGVPVGSVRGAGAPAGPRSRPGRWVRRRELRPAVTPLVAEGPGSALAGRAWGLFASERAYPGTPETRGRALSKTASSSSPGADSSRVWAPKIMVARSTGLHGLQAPIPW